jgi:hypothetical protein
MAAEVSGTTGTAPPGQRCPDGVRGGVPIGDRAPRSAVDGRRHSAIFSFVEPPLIGTEVILGGQGYELVGLRKHTRRDGDETLLLVWSARCAACGDRFETRSPLESHGLSRRCDLHRAPGKRVASRHAAPCIILKETETERTR